MTPNDFVFYENNLLNQSEYKKWYELFAEDGVYWVPGSSKQVDPYSEMSIALENKLLLSLRIERLDHHRAFSLQPAVRGLRVVQAQAQATEPDEAGMVQVDTVVLYTEHQANRTELFPAKVSYSLRPKESSWEIVMKKVDLLGVDGYLPGIQLFV